MRSKELFSIFGVSFFLSLQVPAASASPIVTVTGTFDLGSAATLGLSYVFTFEYDALTPASSTNPFTSVYAGAVKSATFTVAGGVPATQTWTAAEMAANDEIIIENNVSGGLDRFDLCGGICSYNAAGYRFDLFLADTTGTTYSGTQLPGSVSLSQFNIGGFNSPNSLGVLLDGPGLRAQSRFSAITSITTNVPEPSSAALVALGLLGAWFGKRRAS